MIQFLLVLLIFNAYGAEHASWWFKTKCHVYEHCLPGGSLDDLRVLPHPSIKLRDALIDAIERHSIADVAYMFNFYAKTERSLSGSPWEYKPLQIAVTYNAPLEIIRLICNNTRVAKADFHGDRTFLQVAAKNNNIDMACMLFKYGYKPKPITPVNCDEASKIVSFLVNVVERVSDVSLTIGSDRMQDIYYKERTKRIEAVLNATDAATYRIPKPVNALIARYTIENLDPNC